MPRITVENVTKTIRERKVLDNVCLTLEGGHIYGLVGRNGSGKTMLLRVLCGLVFPDSGTVTVDGRRLHRDIPFPPSCGAVIEDIELLADRVIYVSDGKFVERRSVSPFK